MRPGHASKKLSSLVELVDLAVGDGEDVAGLGDGDAGQTPERDTGQVDLHGFFALQIGDVVTVLKNRAQLYYQCPPKR